MIRQGHGRRTSLSVVFRADAGPGIGYGHLMRSAALACELQRGGADVELLVEADPWSTRMLAELHLSSRLTTKLRDRGHLARWAADHASVRRVLLIDRPRLSATYVRTRRKAAAANAVACFVDGEGAPGPVDLALTGSAFWRNGDWPPLPAEVVRCSGPEFVCLRPALLNVRRRRAISPEVESVVVTLGGSDPCGLTLGVVAAIARSIARVQARSRAVYVIVGPGFADRRAVARAIEAATTDATRSVAVDAPRDPSALLAKADVVVAAGGSTLYELAYLGVPTISIPQTEEERANARAMAAAGACACVEPIPGWEGRLTRAFTALLRDQERRRSMRTIGRRLIDGRGALRLARKLAGIASVT